MSKTPLFTPNLTFDQNSSIGIKKGKHGGRYLCLYPLFFKVISDCCKLMYRGIVHNDMMAFHVIFIQIIHNILQTAQAILSSSSNFGCDCYNSIISSSLFCFRLSNWFSQRNINDSLCRNGLKSCNLGITRIRYYIFCKLNFFKSILRTTDVEVETCFIKEDAFLLEVCVFIWRPFKYSFFSFKLYLFRSPLF